MTRTCPRCELDLRALETPSGPTTDYCERCGGVFFDPGELVAFVGLDEGTDFVHEGEVLGPGPACPGCGQGMEERAWPPGSQLLVDVCPRGGVWLDGGEAARMRKELAVQEHEGAWTEVAGAAESGPLEVPVRPLGVLARQSDRRWFLTSAVVVFLTQVAALGALRALEALAVLSDEAAWSSPVQLSVAALLGFFVGGLVSGRISSGFTVWEPAAAAVPACLLFALVFHAPFSVLGLLGLLGTGVLLSLGGAALGERLQP